MYSICTFLYILLNTEQHNKHAENLCNHPRMLSVLYIDWCFSLISAVVGISLEGSITLKVEHKPIRIYTYYFVYEMGVPRRRYFRSGRGLLRLSCWRNGMYLCLWMMRGGVRLIEGASETVTIYYRICGFSLICMRVQVLSLTELEWIYISTARRLEVKICFLFCALGCSSFSFFQATRNFADVQTIAAKDVLQLRQDGERRQAERQKGSRRDRSRSSCASACRFYFQTFDATT